MLKLCNKQHALALIKWKDECVNESRLGECRTRRSAWRGKQATKALISGQRNRIICCSRAASTVKAKSETQLGINIGLAASIELLSDYRPDCFPVSVTGSNRASRFVRRGRGQSKDSSFVLEVQEVGAHLKILF